MITIVGAGTIAVGAPVLGLAPGLGLGLAPAPGHVLGPAPGLAQDRGPGLAPARPLAGIIGVTAPARVRGTRKEKRGTMATTAEAVRIAGSIGALALVLLVLVVMIAMLSVVEPAVVVAQVSVQVQVMALVLGGLSPVLGLGWDSRLANLILRAIGKGESANTRSIGVCVSARRLQLLLSLFLLLTVAAVVVGVFVDRVSSRRGFFFLRVPCVRAIFSFSERKRRQG